MQHRWVALVRGYTETVFDLWAMAIVTGTFLLAGGVKGVIGLGLPTVSLGLLTAAFDLTTAMAILVVPSLITNLWQALAGGHGRAIVSRIWPFLLMATACIGIGAVALSRVDLAVLSALLGVVLIVYAGLNLGGIGFEISRPGERWAGPLFGAINGVLTGMTGSFVVPGVMYLQAIGLPRDMLVQAMGMLFALSTVALAVVLHDQEILNTRLGLISTAAVVPAVVGMIAGRRLRQGLSERRFKRVFFVSIMILGIYIAINAFISS